MNIVSKIVLTTIVFIWMGWLGGCAPKTVIQFRYTESQEPVTRSEVVVRPSWGVLNPFLQFQTKRAMTNTDGEVEFQLNWAVDSDPKYIHLTDSNGDFYEWAVGDNKRSGRQHDSWIDGQGQWVEGYTNIRNDRVEARLIEE